MIVFFMKSCVVLLVVKKVFNDNIKQNTKKVALSKRKNVVIVMKSSEFL